MVHLQDEKKDVEEEGKDPATASIQRPGLGKGNITFYPDC